MLLNPQGKIHLKSANPKLTFIFKHALNDGILSKNTYSFLNFALKLT